MIRHCVYCIILTIMPSLVKAAPYVGNFVGNTDYPAQRYYADSFELTAGYRLSEHWATEFSWLDLGETNLRSDRTDRNDFQIEGTSISMLVFMPIARDVDLFGKFGIYSWEIQSSSITASGLYRSKAREDDADALVGGGLIWYLSDTLALRGQYQLVDVRDDNIRNLSVGLTFSF